MAGVETAGVQRDGLVDTHDLHTAQPEPKEAFLHVIDGPALVPDQEVEDLGEIGGGDERLRGLVAEDRLDLSCSGLAGQRRDDSLRIKDGQRLAFRPSSFAASSARTKARRCSLLRPGPNNEPRGAARYRIAPGDAFCLYPCLAKTLPSRPER
jgi:hypothetical protein